VLPRLRVGVALLRARVDVQRGARDAVVDEAAQRRQALDQNV
jgi:hypothetical protein